MTHENKAKYWLFYTKEESDGSIYDLYAYTDDEDIAEAFKASRCMNKFYLKISKLNRQDYNELIRHHMSAELKMFTGNCRLKNSMKIKKFTIPVTLREEMSIVQGHTIYLQEFLYRFVWDDMTVLKDKYLDALVVLGYPKLHTYISYGDNPISKSAEDSMIANDMNILLDSYGWSFKEG